MKESFKLITITITYTWQIMWYWWKATRESSELYHEDCQPQNHCNLGLVKFIYTLRWTIATKLNIYQCQVFLSFLIVILILIFLFKLYCFRFILVFITALKRETKNWMVYNMVLADVGEQQKILNISHQIIYFLYNHSTAQIVQINSCPAVPLPGIHC